MVVACCGGLFSFASGVREDMARTDAGFGVLRVACLGRGVPAARPLQKGDATHFGQTFDAALNVERTWLPRRFRAPSVRSTMLVVCLGERRELEMETCGAEPDAVSRLLGSDSVVRTVQERSVRVVAAKTGVQIAERVFRGAEPPSCPEPNALGLGQDAADFRGPPPRRRDIARWVGVVQQSGLPESADPLALPPARPPSSPK